MWYFGRCQAIICVYYYRMALNFPISLVGKRGSAVPVCGGGTINQCLDSVIDPAISYAFDGNCNILKQVAGNIPTDWMKSSGANYIYIGTEVTFIGNNAFRFCSQLKELYIPDNVTELAFYVFWEGTSLTKITIGSGLTTVHGGIGFKNSPVTELNMCRLSAPPFHSTFLSNTPNLTEIHVRSNATGYGSSWRGKTVIYDLPAG